MNNLKLKNKICVITGSSSGIGKAIAKAYKKEGGKVVISYNKNKKNALQTAKELDAELVLQLEVSKKKSVVDFFQKINKSYGKIDILVNNAGTNITNDFDKLSEKDWDKVIDINLKGVFLCCQQVIKYMPKNSKIINIGSLSGEYGGPRTPSYAAAKAGVMSLTHNLARFLGKRFINVNCISPGVINNDFTEKTMSTDVRKIVNNLLLIPRLGKFDDLIGMAVLLASDQSNYITGQTISINGGAWVR
mgnify:CR=1 FL=1|tara:strand:- start:240 stop:980 length:741 start_codon:yes stop_codon:yes gene_type:complete